MWGVLRSQVSALFSFPLLKVWMELSKAVRVTPLVDGGGLTDWPGSLAGGGAGGGGGRGGGETPAWIEHNCQTL